MIMRKIILRILAKLIPRAVRAQLKSFKILAIDLGQWRSIKEERPVNKKGNPIPWYTYPAIEYLKRLNFSDKIIFEWGSGNSSLFWARRAREVMSIEDNKKWFNMVNKNKLGNQKIILIEKKNDYIKTILNQNKKFDIIVIDGKHRYECSKNAVKCLSEVGLIILDNSDWFPKTAKILREHNLIQVDFSGFGPVNSYTSTTSLFFSRNFDFKIPCFNQPLQPIGGVKQYGDE